MITTTIVIPENGEIIKKLFAAEERTLVNDRASYNVTTTRGEASINVSASDATALRAVLNSICKILITYEKAKKATEDDK